MKIKYKYLLEIDKNLKGQIKPAIILELEKLNNIEYINTSGNEIRFEYKNIRFWVNICYIERS